MPPGLFPCPDCRIYSFGRPPGAFTPGFILLGGAASPELLRDRLRSLPFGRELTAGVSSLFATSPERIHSQAARIPTLASFRPRVFATPRRFPPRSGSEASFILEPRPGLIRVQGLLPPRSASLSSRALTPLPLAPLALSGTFRTPSPHQWRLGFEASFRAEVRSHRLGVQPDRWPLPSSGSAPPGSPPSGPVPVTQHLPLMTSRNRPSLARSSNSVRLQRIAPEGPDGSVSRSADLPEFSGLPCDSSRNQHSPPLG